MSQHSFRSYGGFYQLQIVDAEDLERLDVLDRARWAATSAPIDQLHCDPAYLAFLDADRDGRIRVEDLRAARRWIWDRLKDRAALIAGRDELALADLDLAHPDAARLERLARRLLAQLGAGAQERIRLAEVRRFQAEYVRTFPNGDGVVSAEQVEDPALADAITLIAATTGGSTDLSGAAGVAVGDVDRFVARAAEVLAWRGRPSAEPTLLPLGEDTAAAAALLDGLAPKLDQFFAQCALVRVEPHAPARLQATPEQLAALDVASPAAISAWLDDAPLARPEPSGELALTGAVNPRFAAPLRRLADELAPRLLGLDGPLERLDQPTWQRLTAALDPWRAWSALTPTDLRADVPDERLRALLESDAAERLRALCEADQGVAQELQEFHQLELLVLHQRWFLELVNNFVSFPRLFDPEDLSLFQAGTLILDGRKLTLTTRVTDKGGHRKLAESSLMFVVYADLARKDGGADRKATISAPVTAGVRGGIGVGKRGVFYDRDGVEWDAIVTDVIVQPISLLEAILAPFERVRDMVAERVEKAVASKATALEGAATKKAELPAAPAAPTPPPAAPAAGGGLQGTLIGGSIAFAAIGSSMAFIVGTLASLTAADVLLGVGGLAGGLVLVFGFLGWLKLRRRDISALLEASGWALNGRMRLTQRLSLVFTQQPGVPRGARRHADATVWPLVVVPALLVLALVAAWVLRPAWFEAAPPAAPPAAEEPAPAE